VQALSPDSGLARHYQASAPLVWPEPDCVFHSDRKARPGYDSASKSEFLDSPAVLEAKVKELARMIRKSQRVVAYTGAGLSTASGIGDYASAVGGLVHAHGLGPHIEWLKAQGPTNGHRALAALERQDYLHAWINQNHDGLAQKATFPMAKLNECHGSWFDKRNPVVHMNGAVRDDLDEDIDYWADHADLVLALGTSLSGLSADRVALEAAKRQGLVIISLQRTKQDCTAALRIFSKLDDALIMLARELNAPLPTMEECHRATYDHRNPALAERKKFGTHPPASSCVLSWYQAYYSQEDKSWTRETELHCAKRAQPSGAYTKMLKAKRRPSLKG
jgi:NAD-dependent SIR2 family protein deacetylase